MDPEATRITLVNDMGTFAPFLAECLSIAPIAEPGGDWRVELVTGTVLVGPLREAEIAFGLPMGPDTLTVPLDRLVSLDRSTWADGMQQAPRGQGYAAPAPSAPVTAEPALKSSEGWFENKRMEDAKR